MARPGYSAMVEPTFSSAEALSLSYSALLPSSWVILSVRPLGLNSQTPLLGRCGDR